MVRWKPYQHLHDRKRRVLAGTAVLAVLSMAISGCAVGPNFNPAAKPEVDGYVHGKLASPDAGSGPPHVAGQHFVTGADVSARWWAAFRSPLLNELIKQSVDHNPNLQAAEAAIKVAQYNALAQRGLFFPQVTGNTTPQQFLISNPSQVPPVPIAGPQTQFSLVTNQLTVSFVPDIWGANFRAVENLDAVTEQQLFQLEAAYLTLTSNVVTAAIQEASLRGQIAATQRIIAIERNLLDILKRQQSFGQAAQADVLAQDAALAQAEELLPPLEKQLAQQRDLLTSLAGQYAADEISQKFDLAHLKLPANLPISLPSKLVDAAARCEGGGSQHAFGQRSGGRGDRGPASKYRALGQWRIGGPQLSRKSSRPEPDSIPWQRAPPRRSSTVSRCTISRRRPKPRSNRPKPSIAPPSSPHSRTSPMPCGRCKRMRAP